METALYIKHRTEIYIHDGEPEFKHCATHCVYEEQVCVRSYTFLKNLFEAGFQNAVQAGLKFTL